MSTANGSTQAVNTPVSDAAVPAASPAPSAEPAAVAPPPPDAAATPAANGATSASADAAEHPAPPAQPAEADTAQAGVSAEAAGPSEPAKASAEPIPALPENADELLKEFYADVKDVDRNNEVLRIIGAFRLNGFEQLGLPFDATPEDIRKAYRKLSLLVHPDKCSHPQAKAAFEIVNAASKQLQDDDRRRELVHVLNLSRDEIRKDRRKAVKHDSVHRLAILVHSDGMEGVEAAWEKSPAFHETWKEKARDMLARAEFRRQKLSVRLKNEEHRVEEEEAETRVKLKAMREHHKKWEGTRDKRINSWRDFASNKKAKKSKPLGGIKPPKLKMEDEDRTFVQRSAVEQFKAAGKFTAPKPHREED